MICNTGIGLIPRIDDEVGSFALAGLYDGLFLFSDEKTGTYWNHMTGEAMYGPLAGEKLELYNVLHSTVRQVLAQDDAALVAISEHPRVALSGPPGGAGVRSLGRRVGTWLSRLTNLGERGLSGQFKGTIRAEDDRRPTMELGIGIWDGSAARYYAMPTLEEHDRALLDTFEGRTVLVYYDPMAYALIAHYTTADRVWWADKVLHLSTGERIENGLLFNGDGEEIEADSPLQVFTRWYGFSLTFPETEVYGGG